MSNLATSSLSTQPASLCSPPDLRFLLVEDDAVTMEVIAAMLSSLGPFQIATASTGPDALAILADGHPGIQVVLCDLRMPGMDGLELIRHLSTRRSCYGVVLLSGEDGRILASAQELARAQGLRVLGALSKPVTREQLRQTLVGICAGQQPLRSLPPLREVFRPDMEDLARGIAARELIVHYQPRISARDRRVLGVEGLVRWQHPTAGIVPPGAFIPLAEQAGLIDPLTTAVFDLALTDLATWRRAGLDIVVSLNATVDSLARLDFANQLVEMASNHEVPLNRVVVEVTESRLTSHLDRVLETLARLRLNRVGVAIDDFGTGYSTMEQLRRIPFTELKVDRSFVRGAKDDKTTRTILESSVRLARQLGMTSVAEGVETTDDFDVVLQAGCDEVQGYLFAKPMPERQVRPWIATFE